MQRLSHFDVFSVGIMDENGRLFNSNGCRDRDKQKNVKTQHVVQKRYAILDIWY